MTLSLYSVSTDFVSRNANFVSLLTPNHSGLGAIRHQSSDFNSVVRSHSVSAGGHCDITTEEVLSISDKHIDLNSSVVALSGKISRYKIFVNVGNMEYSGGDERIAFGPMAKGQKKYGATSSRFKKQNDPVLVYNVQLGDTMQGLAVKFGVTTEQIRRANNLWTNDSLFLRDKLLIPVVGSGNGQDGSSGSQQGECSSRTSCSDTEGDLTSSLDNENEGSLPPCLHRLDSDNSRTGGGLPPNAAWSHPLCDEYYERDCTNWETESDVPLGGESLTYQAAASHCHPLGRPNGAKNADPTIYNGRVNDRVDFTSPTSNNAATNGNDVGRPSSSMSNGTTTSNPLSPTSQSSSSKIVDYSEKSAKDFLSRIDSAIASSRIRAKNKDAQNDHEPWVTFDSDGESSDLRHSSGTSITTQGRHLRYSLRKLEKAQDELFQL